MAVERLQKILSNTGVASRRVAEELILAGRVRVNGVVLDTLGARADLEIDEITVDGEPVTRGQYRYFMLNKPPGFVTTASDELGRETVMDLVPIGDIVLHPVGRLDADSEGLLLLTNDGHLTGMLTHPKYEVEKEYLVGLARPLARADQERLVRGIDSEGERLRAASVKTAQPSGEDPEGIGGWVLLVLKQGRKREIRRMMTAIGQSVRVLRRVRVGPLVLGALGSGAFRELTEEEVSALYEVAKKATGAMPAAR